MLDWLIEHKVPVMLVDFAIMVISGISFLVTKWNFLGFVLIATILIGLVFATIDVELHDQEAEQAEEEAETI